jgi:hypothetical protein
VQAQSLNSIRQNGWALATAAAMLTRTQSQTGTQLQAIGQSRERVLAHEIGTHTRQVALGQIVQPFIQHGGNRRVEHRVA